MAGKGIHGTRHHEKAHPAKRGPARHGGAPLVAIVEDQEKYRAILRKALMAHGYRVIAPPLPEDPAELVAEIRAADAFALDHHLGQDFPYDGSVVAEGLRKAGKSAIVGISTAEQDYVRERFGDKGAMDLCSKMKGEMFQKRLLDGQARVADAVRRSLEH